MLSRLLAVGLALSLVGNLGQWAVINNTKYKLSVQEKALAIKAKEYAEYRLKKEREMAAAVHTAEVKHQQRAENAEKEFNDVIADLRSDNLKLRKRFTCPPRPEHPGETGSVGEGEEGGLSREDAEFLISEAKRADDITLELALAKEYIDILLEKINGR